MLTVRPQPDRVRRVRARNLARIDSEQNQKKTTDDYMHRRSTLPMTTELTYVSKEKR